MAMNSTLSSIAGAITTIAPTLATMLGGPLAGTAVTALEGILGVKGPDAIAQVITAQQLTPEQLVAIKNADNEHAEKMKQLDIDLATLNANSTAAFNVSVVDDVKDARQTAKGNDKVYDIGIFILGSFLVAMIAVLWGCWSLISGQVTITPQMAGMFAAVTGLVGSIVGYFASNAQTVINFLYGGSLGGRKNADALSDSVASMGTALGKAANSPTPTTMIDSTVTASK